MRRLLDLLLIVTILGAVGFGVYLVGTRVDTTSNTLARQDSELGQTVYHPTNPAGPSRHTIELFAIGVGGAAAVMLVVSVGSTLVKGRRRQRWRVG